jgi:hypothetical protein
MNQVSYLFLKTFCLLIKFNFEDTCIVYFKRRLDCKQKCESGDAEIPESTGELIKNIFENDKHSLALDVAKDVNKNVSGITWFEENEEDEYGFFAFEYPVPCPRII